MCLYLFPDEDIDPDEAACPEGAVAVDVPAEPLLWACVIVFPDGANANANGHGHADERGNRGGGGGQSGEHGPSGDPPCGQGQAGEKNPNCEEPDDGCPEGALLDEEIGGVVYACVILFPEGETAECPEGFGPIALPADPLVNACVTLNPNGS